MARVQTLLDDLTGAAILTATGASWQEQGDRTTRR
jgi:hypothetical protein